MFFKDFKPAKPAKGGAGKKGKKETLSSADKIRLANQAKKQAKEDDSNVTWWKEQLVGIEDRPIAAKIVAIELILRNKRTKEGWLAVEARLYRIHLEFSRWLEDATHESASVRDRYTVSIMCMVKDLYESKEPFPTAAKYLAMSLVALGFADYIEAFENSATIANEDRHLSFEFVKLVKSKSGSPVHKWMRITEDPVVWQLRLFGEFMDRSMDSAPDPRVSFKPDAWQRKVLDCLDRNESVLVAGRPLMFVQYNPSLTAQLQRQRVPERHSSRTTRWRSCLGRRTMISSFTLLRRRPLSAKSQLRCMQGSGRISAVVSIKVPSSDVIHSRATSQRHAGQFIRGITAYTTLKTARFW